MRSVSLSIRFFTVIFLTLHSLTAAFAQGVGINGSGGSPDNSAGLDVDFSNKGLLIPRLTTTQRDAINAPATSLFIFNTDVSCFQTYLNGQWQNLFCDQTCVTAPAIPDGIVGDASPCQGSLGVIYSVSPVPGANSYTWTVPYDAVIIGGQGTTSIVVNLGYSSESISVIASNGCGASAPQVLPLSMSNLPSGASIDGSFYVCAGTTGVAYSVNPEPGVTYQWSFTGGTIVSGQGTSSIVVDIDNNVTNCTVEVQPTNACGTAGGNSVSFSVSPLVLLGAFGSNGTTTENPSGSTDILNALATDATGLYLGGYDIADGVRWRLQKRNVTNGTIDWTYAVNPNNNGGGIYGVAVDGTGVFAAGQDGTGANQCRVQKHDLNTGSVLWSVTENPSGGSDGYQSIVLDGTSMYLGGYDNTSGSDGWRVQRRSTLDGSITWTQSSNPSSNTDQIMGVAKDASGLYVAGYDSGPGNRQWRIEKRSLVNGSVIWSQTANPSGSDDEARAIVVDATGVYISGYDQAPGNYEWRIEKRDLNTGALIWSESQNVTSGVDISFALAINASALFVGGYDGTGNRQWRLEKRDLATGALITAQTSNPSGGNDECYGMTMHSSGVFMGGYDSVEGNARWRVEKRCP